MVFVGGQGPLNVNGALVGPGDFPLQVETAFKNLETAQAAAGASLKDVVQLRTSLVSAPETDLAVYRQARERHFGASPERPVATTVLVSGTTVEGMLIVLDAVAVLPD